MAYNIAIFLRGKLLIAQINLIADQILLFRALLGLSYGGFMDRFTLYAVTLYCTSLHYKIDCVRKPRLQES